MHYTQYLYLTHKVYIKRNNQADQNGRYSIKNKFFNKYIITIFIYALIMAVFSTFWKTQRRFFKSFDYYSYYWANVTLLFRFTIMEI